MSVRSERSVRLNTYKSTMSLTTDFGWCKIPTTLSFQKQALLNPGGGLQRYYTAEKPIPSIEDLNGRVWQVNDIRFGGT
jgi:hypothetical protein